MNKRFIVVCKLESKLNITISH